jgi:hypothetical protein
MKSLIFWDITPCSPFKVNRRFGGTCRLAPASRLVSSSAYSSTLKTEATCSSETSVDFQRTIQRYIPEDKLFISRVILDRSLPSVSRLWLGTSRSHKQVRELWRYIRVGFCKDKIEKNLYMQMCVSLQNVLWSPSHYLLCVREQVRSLSGHIALSVSARFGPFICH